MPNRTSSAIAVAAATAALSLASPIALAEVRCSTTPIEIPQNIDGVYINFATGVTGTSSTAVPGFDFNPWYNGGNGGLSFYMGTDGDANNGAVFDTVAPSYRVLVPGTDVGPGSTFSGAQSNAANMAAWRVGVDGYLGVRFTNDVTGAVNYGWVHMTTTGNTGFPARILAYCFENTGKSIGVAVVPVTLQSFSID